MAQAAWPRVFKDMCGTPDFDSVTEQLTQAQRGIGEIKRWTVAVDASLLTLRKAVEGGLDQMAGFGERLCVVERRTDDFLALAAEQDNRVGELRGSLVEQGNRVNAFEGELKSAVESFGRLQSGLEQAVQGLARASDSIALHEKRLGEADAHIRAQAGAIEALTTDVAVLKAWVARSSRRWNLLWAWIQLLPLRLPGCPATPYSDLLQGSGHKDLDAVAAANASELAQKLKEQNARAKSVDDDPDEDDADELIRIALRIGGAAAATGTRRRGK